MTMPNIMSNTDEMLARTVFHRQLWTRGVVLKKEVGDSWNKT